MKCMHCGKECTPLLMPINKETAEYYGINEATLRIYAGAGKLPSTKIGRRRYINTRKLEAYIEDKTRMNSKDQLKVVEGT